VCDGYLSGARCRSFACGPADANGIPPSLASLKSILVLINLSGAGLPRVVFGKEAVSLCLSVCCVITVDKRVCPFCYEYSSFMCSVLT